MSDLLARLRAIDEETMQRALDGAYVEFPIKDAAEFLELFNRVVGEIAGHWDGDGPAGEEFANEGQSD